MASLAKLVKGGVARRIVGLFIVSALLPVVTMAGVSFFAVSNQLEDQSRERLTQLSKNSGQSILQQLNGIQTGLHGLRDLQALQRGVTGAILTGGAVQGLGTTGPDGVFTDVGGLPDAPTPPSTSEFDRMRSGRMIVRVSPGREPALTVAVPLAPGDPAAGTLWASIEGDSIWGAAQTFADLPYVVDFCVGDGKRTLHCRSGSERFMESAPRTRTGSGLTTASFRDEDGRYLVGQWSFYPDGDFEGDPWVVLVAEDVDAVFAATASFTKMFGLALLLALLLVVLLSQIQIRRTMEPLTALQEGTRRIARGDLASRVDVQSDDEFGGLATSFNAMAGRLATQFAQFEAAQAIGEAALGTFERDSVVLAALEQFPIVCGCRSAAILVTSTREATSGDILWVTRPGTLGGTAVELETEDLTWIQNHPEYGTDAPDIPLFHAVRRGLGNGGLVAFPHRVKSDLRGATILEFPPGAEALTPETVRRLRQLCDQVTVALEDVRLVRELDELSWGALLSMARAIDAKSEWTWGHSERVTEMALALGRELDLDEADLNTLHRGGLLHDIGKIGVPGTVLDKPGKLTEEEFALVQQHPDIGARILAPIEAFSASLPLVRHHHEKWDGTGYPSGLEGEEIPFLARILTVADAYDAIGSPRPYRPAVAPDVVLERIVADSGTHFDPVIVDALVRHMSHVDRMVIRETTRVGV